MLLSSPPCQPRGMWGWGRVSARTVPLPASDTTSSPEALRLEPWSPPPPTTTAGVAVCPPRDRSRCLSDPWRARNMMGGGEPEAGSLERAALLPKCFPALAQPPSSCPCSAACLPGVPDLGRPTLLHGFWRQEAFSRKQLEAQVSLALSPHLRMPPGRGGWLPTPWPPAPNHGSGRVGVEQRCRSREDPGD